MLAEKSKQAHGNPGAASHQYVRGATEPNAIPLLQLLQITAPRHCYDPLDKLYALYGMVPKIQEVYPIDYAKSPDQVLLETTAFMVNYEWGIFAYKSFGLRDGNLSFLSYPSWVPEYRHSFQAGLHNPQLSHASGDLVTSLQQWDEAPPAQVSDDLTTLSISAWNLGAISSCFQFADTEEEVILQIRSLLQSHRTDPPLDSSIASLLRGIREQGSVAWRIARACVVYWSTHVEHTCKDIIDAFEGVFQTRGQRVERFRRGNTTWTMCSSAVKSLLRRTFFVTNEGLF